MNILLWIIQGILSAIFLLAGITKSTTPAKKLKVGFPWTNDYSIQTVRLIGIAELLGAVGLIVPCLTGITPILTPLAAAALGLIMILAASYHGRKKEYKAVVVNVFWLLLTAFVACGRF
jgi:uncharacterized membrane protein